MEQVDAGVPETEGVAAARHLPSAPRDVNDRDRATGQRTQDSPHLSTGCVAPEDGLAREVVRTDLAGANGSGLGRALLEHSPESGERRATHGGAVIIQTNDVLDLVLVLALGDGEDGDRRARRRRVGIGAVLEDGAGQREAEEAGGGVPQESHGGVP